MNQNFSLFVKSKLLNNKKISQSIHTNVHFKIKADFSLLKHMMEV
jgi:hypothetical protein